MILGSENALTGTLEVCFTNHLCVSQSNQVDNEN
jgi:hypothetical protein